MFFERLEAISAFLFTTVKRPIWREYVNLPDKNIIDNKYLQSNVMLNSKSNNLISVIHFWKPEYA